MRPRVIDAFPFAGTPTELLLLECRLTELYDAVDQFVIVEAKVDHQDHPKPLNYVENEHRFFPWRDKITYVVAENMPSLAQDDWSWAREHAQRESIILGLHELDAQPDDIILQSDLDEFPTALAARNVRPQRDELISFRQRGHFWAVDWEYPPGWQGTVACRVGMLPKLAANRNCGPFAAMRDARNSCPKVIPNGGWHFSWLGGTPDTWMTKVRSFCHPEVEQRLVENADRYFRDGIHVDGIVMRPVEVDHTWPKWMQDPKNVPYSWRRPR